MLYKNDSGNSLTTFCSNMIFASSKNPLQFLKDLERELEVSIETNKLSLNLAKCECRLISNDKQLSKVSN